MCNLSEGVFQRGFQEGIEQGIERGTERNLLSNITKLMRKMNLGIDEAMDLLDVEDAQRKKIMKNAEQIRAMEEKILAAANEPLTEAIPYDENEMW